MAISSLRAGALKFVTNTGLAQLIVLVSTPVLTRLYDPSAFGVVALFGAFYGLLVPIATLKLDQAVVLPKEDSAALQLSILSVVLAIPSSIFALAGVVVAVVEQRPAPWVFFLLPVALVNGAILTAGQQWFTRAKAYSRFGISMLVTSVANVVCAILFHFLHLAGAGLVLSFFVGNVCATIYVCAKNAQTYTSLIGSIGFPSVSDLQRLFWKYRNIPLHVLPNILLTSLTFQALPILITHFFDAHTTGLYAVANRLLVLPSIVVGNAAAEVFKSELVTRLREHDKPHAFFRRMFFLLLGLSIAIYGVLWLVSPRLFFVVFGKDFASAGSYARLLCPGVAGTMFVQIFSYTYIALDRTKRGLVLQLVLSTAQIAGFVIGAVQGRIELALLYTSIASVCASGLLVYASDKLLLKEVRNPRHAPGTQEITL